MGRQGGKNIGSCRGTGGPGHQVSGREEAKERQGQQVSETGGDKGGGDRERRSQGETGSAGVRDRGR
jgi:hypothetical protein